MSHLAVTALGPLGAEYGHVSTVDTPGGFETVVFGGRMSGWWHESGTATDAMAWHGYAVAQAGTAGPVDAGEAGRYAQLRAARRRG